VIGVVADPHDLDVVCEFFELFKTAWEPAVVGRRYAAILSTQPVREHFDTAVALVYGSKTQPVDERCRMLARQVQGPTVLEWGTHDLPIYGDVAVFAPTSTGLPTASGMGEVGYSSLAGTTIVRRIGYDLFDETRHLLTQGQPAFHAAAATLDWHIDLLRAGLRESGVPFVEALPKPAGFDRACCLTHDVDFCGIRRHRFDRTLAGFMARGTLGTLADLVRGRRTRAEAFRNWKAVLSLPGIFMGLARDFWAPFDDYEAADRGHRSTFFLVPFKGRPGVAPDGTVDRTRAVPYGIAEIGQDAAASARRGHELALHGIDAWRDAGGGRAELGEVTAVTGRSRAGVRMHWLYFDAQTPRTLASAGFDYDSTFGYNDAVGYRAGTLQAFCFPGTDLLELPLAIMDSALFSRGRLGLDFSSAMQRCRPIVDHALRAGGTLVVNWHERSLAPERLWGAFYDALLDEISTGGRTWFATAREAAAWYRWRRSIRFTEEQSIDSIRVQVAAAGTCEPGVVVRVYGGFPYRAIASRDFAGGTPIAFAFNGPAVEPVDWAPIIH
jgi:hypothetical protein